MVGCLKFVDEGNWDLKRLKKDFTFKKKESMCAPPAYTIWFIS